jgi:hypothetical protein
MLASVRQVLLGGTLLPSFYAPLMHSLALERGQGTATFTRTTTATVWGYQESDISGASQSLLTIPSGIPRFEGARFIASNNTWSEFYADGAPIPASTLRGLLVEGQRTNYLLNSDTPATQTTGSLSTGSYTLWVVGSGSAEVSADTATITGAGTAMDGTPVNFSVTGAGTVAVTVTGSLTRFQMERGAFASSYIPSAAATVTRNADLLLYPVSENILSTTGAVYAEILVQSSGYTGRIVSSRGGGSGGVPLYIENTILATFDGSASRNGPAFSGSPSIQRVGALWKKLTTQSIVSGTYGPSRAFDGDINLQDNFAIGSDTDGTLSMFGTIRNVKIWRKSIHNHYFPRLTA